MVGPKPVRPLLAKNNSVDDNLDKSSTKPKVKKIKDKKLTTTSNNALPKEVDKTTSSVVPEVEKEPMKETALVKIDRKQIEEGVRAFSKLVELGLEDKKDLFASDGQKVSLQVSGIKLPKSSDSQVLKCSLPHSPLPVSKDVCLFVKDLEKGIKVDHEETVRHFTSMLEDKGVKGVTQVIALRELKVEYKQYEAKTQLVHRFDKFLADARIIRLLPPLLGKAFYKRKMLPVQVNLNAKNLSAEFSKIVNTVTLPLKNSGSCASVVVGLTTMEQKNLVENTAKLVQMLEDKYPGGWKNVRSVHLRCGQVSLPLYVSLRATQEVGMVHGAKRDGKGVVVDELSTVVGATVIVTPGGAVRVKRKKDPEWSDDDESEKIVDSKEGDKENNDEPTEDAEDTKDKSNEGEKSKRQKKNEAKKKEVDAEDDSEDELEDKELEYMQKVAEEEEEMEKKIEATEEKQIEKLKDAKENDEEPTEDEDVIDDDAEAENLLSEGDESDSDEELIMKNKATVEDEESEEEDKPMRKKKKKVKKAQVEKTPSATKKSSKQRKFIEKKKKEKNKNKK